MSDRAPQPRRTSASADELADYDFVVRRFSNMDLGSDEDGDAGPYFGALLNSPPLARGLVNMGQLVRAGQLRGTYTNAEREIADVVLSHDFGYNGVLGFHIPDGVAWGMRIDVVEAVNSDDLDELTVDERQLVDYVRQVVSGGVTDASWTAMVARFGLRGAVEYTIFVSFLNCTLRLWQAFDVPAMSDEDVARVVDEIRRGVYALPQPTERIG